MYHNTVCRMNFMKCNKYFKYKIEYRFEYSECPSSLLFIYNIDEYVVQNILLRIQIIWYRLSVNSFLFLFSWWYILRPVPDKSNHLINRIYIYMLNHSHKITFRAYLNWEFFYMPGLFFSNMLTIWSMSYTNNICAQKFQINRSVCFFSVQSGLRWI
jgi:hypothetical protein